MKTPLLFLDRDGTLIKEPPVDYQVDSLEKLEFVPGVFRNMHKIKNFTPFKLVLVSNQDGRGTPVFPEEDFRLPHDKFLEAFRNEGVEFDGEHIDPSLPGDNSPNRKPGTGMLQEYQQGEYDLEASYVIGDRMTDMELARNLGCKGILLAGDDRFKEVEKQGLSDWCVLHTESWDEIYRFLRASLRQASVERMTSETRVKVDLSLDGSGLCKLNTGLGFFDHMLDQLGRHGGLDLAVEVEGDLVVDEHHTMEDTALVLGQAIDQALGDKRGIARYAFVLPMDDCLASVAIDFGGRPWTVWEVSFKREKIGDVPTEMFFHFFKSFSDAARCNLNIKAEGSNEHHKIEAIFKAFARALKAAVSLDPESNALPTTKGKL